MDSKSPQYLLSKHAFMCVAQGHVVFLDLKKDRYSSLTRDEALRVRKAVVGWPPIVPEVGTPDSPHDGETLLRELREEGLITNEALSGKTANPITLEKPSSDLHALMHSVPSVPVLHRLNFIAAWARITLALRVRSLEHSIERVRRRKAAWGYPALPLDLDRVRPLIASYFELQPQFFSSVDTCLRNSLTLTEYLARNGIYPTWVFGVHMEPWAAHSWVQDGSVVLNDTVENVRNFTPILAI